MNSIPGLHHKSITYNPHINETHPWPAHIDNKATSLLIGTFPICASYRSLDFYYSDNTNRFWQTLSSITGISVTEDADLNTYNPIVLRKEILGKLKLGITDMGHIVIRQRSNSYIGDIFPLKFMDIFKILIKNPAINSLIFTNQEDSNCALTWFMTYCSLNKVKCDNAKEAGYLQESDFKFNNKNYKIIVLPSPSIPESEISNEKLIEIYGNALPLK